MLPGFRFLFAAIVLSVSTLVFGLGAAALLRASHERFASLPATPPAPTLSRAVVADTLPRDATLPTLALLQVDTPDLDSRSATETRAPTTTGADHRDQPPAAAAAEPILEEEAARPVADETPMQAAPDIAAPAANATATEPPKTAEAAPSPPEMPPATVSTPIEAAASGTTAAPDAASTNNEMASSDLVKVATAPVEAATDDHGKAEQETGTAEPAKTEPTKTEAEAPRIAEAAPEVEVRPTPIAPAEAPIKTAMLAPGEPAPSTVADPAVAITGPIPLPRSREWALAQGHAAQQAARARRLAAARAKSRPVVRQQVRPQAQAPAAAPNPFFPFAE